MKYPIAPNGIFWTLQGEGALLGVPMRFVRLADHPVRPDRPAEIMAMFRELHERLGKLLEGKS